MAAITPNESSAVVSTTDTVVKTENQSSSPTPAVAVEQKTAGVPLCDFVQQLEDFVPTIPDSVTCYYLSRAGFDTTDPRIIRLISLASQKFVSDIANDALQHCKMKASGQSSKKQGKERRLTLTMEDLAPALSEHGMTLKKPCYFL